MKKLFGALALFAFLAYGDTPPPGVVGLKGGTDNTKIGNVTDSLKVNVTNSSPVTVPTPLPVTFSTPLPVTFPTPLPTQIVTQGTIPWAVSFPTPLPTQPVIGPLTDTQLRAVAVPVSFPTPLPTQPVVGPLTDTQLRASAVPVSFPTPLPTQPISGTVTANIGTTNGLALDASVTGLQVNQASTTASQKGSLIQGAVTTGAPTYTTAQTSPLSLDTSGNLRVSGSFSPSGTQNVNVTQYGSTSTTLGQKAMTASQPVVIASDQSAIPVSFPTPLPTQPVVGPLTDTQLRAAPVPVSFPTPFPTQPISGTIAATQSGAWSVTANAGTNLNTSALALDTSVNGILLTQGTTTSGKTGPLIQGSVTTAAPTYTTAQTSPLSLTTAGALRIDGSATTQPVSGPLTDAQLRATAVPVSFPTPLPTQPISGTIAATQSGTWTVQPGNTANSTAWLVTGTGGTFPSTQSGTWNINNISGTVSLPTGAATAVTQGSSTSGQSGTLMQGAVTTAAPTYTTAQTSPLSLTTAGALRIDGSATTQPISSTALTTIATQTQYVPISSAASHTTGNVSTVITLSAPSNAVGFILEAKDSNTANIRWAMGATATTTSGMQLQPGRDTGYVPAGVSISIVSESGTQEYQVQWVSTH